MNSSILMNFNMNYKYPSREKCVEYLNEYGTPEHVIGHCKAVADVAVTVGKRLNEKGLKLNIGLIEAAGLTHDLARVEDKHWEVAANFLCKKGYESVADIVKVHMYYPQFSKPEETTETDLVCLGDRTVKEDKYVGVEERMAYIINKAQRNSGDPEVIERILEKKKQLISYINGLEKIMGVSLEQLMKGH